MKTDPHSCNRNLSNCELAPPQKKTLLLNYSGIILGIQWTPGNSNLQGKQKMVQVTKGKISRKNYLKGKRIYFKLAESWHYQGLSYQELTVY